MVLKMIRCILRLTLFLLVCIVVCCAFQSGGTAVQRKKRISFPAASTVIRLGGAAFESEENPVGSTRRRREKDEGDIHFLMKPFVVQGEAINPYSILGVPRNADISQIKTSYKRLAKRYHPDGLKHRDILPGKCNSEDDVREHWEKIRVAYEILSDKKARARYDRSEMIADPAGAAFRAATGATLNGVTSIGRGLFGLGAFALGKINGDDEQK